MKNENKILNFQKFQNAVVLEKAASIEESVIILRDGIAEDLRIFQLGLGKKGDAKRLLDTLRRIDYFLDQLRELAEMSLDKRTKAEVEARLDYLIPHWRTEEKE